MTVNSEAREINILLSTNIITEEFEIFCLIEKEIS